jgi:hypothetical protein
MLVAQSAMFGDAAVALFTRRCVGVAAPGASGLSALHGHPQPSTRERQRLSRRPSAHSLQVNLTHGAVPIRRRDLSDYAF